jgi:hypothetical protein
MRWRWDRRDDDADAARRKLWFHCRQGKQQRPASVQERTIIYDDTSRADYDDP